MADGPGWGCSDIVLGLAPVSLLSLVLCAMFVLLLLKPFTLITLDTRKEEKKRIPVYLHLGNEKIWRLFKFPMFF